MDIKNTFPWLICATMLLFSDPNQDSFGIPSLRNSESGEYL